MGYGSLCSCPSPCRQKKVCMSHFFVKINSHCAIAKVKLSFFFDPCRQSTILCIAKNGLSTHSWAMHTNGVKKLRSSMNEISITTGKEFTVTEP